MFPNKRSRTINLEYPSTMASHLLPQSHKHPCAVCAFTRKKSTDECQTHPAIFQGRMSSNDYDTIFRGFGTRVVTKTIASIPPHQHLATLNSFLFEAKSRILNPVYGGIYRIESLEQRLEELQLRVFELEIKLMSGSSTNYLGETLAPPGGFTELLASIIPKENSPLIPPTLDLQSLPASNEGTSNPFKPFVLQSLPASNEGTSNPFKAFVRKTPSVYPTLSDYQSSIEIFPKSPSQISQVVPPNLNQGGSSNFDIGCSSNINLDSTANLYSSNMLNSDWSEFSPLSQQEIEELLSFDTSDLPNPDSLPSDYGLGDISNNLGEIDIAEFIGTTSSVDVTKETEDERQDIDDEAQESEE